jgi:hypothetical protein
MKLLLTFSQEEFFQTVDGIDIHTGEQIAGGSGGQAAAPQL